jgi:snurportin-1
MGPSLLRPGRLLRFSLRGAGLLFNPRDGAPAGADLAYEGPANQRRGRADSLSKVVFQWQARRAPLRLPQLLAAAVGRQQQQQQQQHSVLAPTGAPTGEGLAALADAMPAAEAVAAANGSSSDAAMITG